MSNRLDEIKGKHIAWTRRIDADTLWLIAEVERLESMVDQLQKNIDALWDGRFKEGMEAAANWLFDNEHWDAHEALKNHIVIAAAKDKEPDNA